MRIAIIGDSHTAAMKFALDDDPTLAGSDEITFFASPAGGLQALAVSDGKLVPKSAVLAEHFVQTSGGSSEIDPADYDAFLLVSLGLIAPQLDMRLSSAMRHDVISDTVRISLARPIANRVRRLSNRPLFALHRPLPAYDGSNIRMMDYATVFAEMEKNANDLGLPLLQQAPETLEAGAWTRPEFSQSSRRLLSQAEHEQADNVHMNADFGKITLAHVVSAIKSASA